jgi:hypothetical protein
VCLTETCDAISARKTELVEAIKDNGIGRKYRRTWNLTLINDQIFFQFFIDTF